MNTYIDESIKHQKVISFKACKEGHDVTIAYKDYFKTEQPYLMSLVKAPQLSKYPHFKTQIEKTKM